MIDRNGNPALSVQAGNGEILPVSLNNPLPVQIITVDNKISEITKNPDNQDFEEKILFAETEEKNGKLIFKKINENIFSLKKSTEEYLSDVVYAKAGLYYVNCYVFGDLANKTEYSDEDLQNLFYFSGAGNVGDDIYPALKLFRGNAENYQGNINSIANNYDYVHYYKNTVLHTDESKPLFEAITTGDPIDELKQGLTIVKIA